MEFLPSRLRSINPRGSSFTYAEGHYPRVSPYYREGMYDQKPDQKSGISRSTILILAVCLMLIAAFIFTRTKMGAKEKEE